MTTDALNEAAPRTPYRASLKTDIFLSLTVGIILTSLSYGLAILFGWLDEVNWLEAFAVWTSYSATYLSIRQRRYYYIAGILSTAVYVIVFLQSNLLASAILNGYLALTLIYGFIIWGKDSNTKPVQHWKLRTAPWYILATAVIYGLAVLLVSLLGGSFAFWDAAILAFTILAQLMLDRKVLENWIVWVLGVNTIGVILYFNSGLPLVSFQQALFLLASIYGYFAWRKGMNRGNV